MPRRYDTEATRTDLISSARSLFSEFGYADTGTETIVARAGVTRGALYHHFGNKEGLFVAVLELVQAELAHAVNDSASSIDGGPLPRLKHGFRVWLQTALGADTRRILLVDGPAVVGWARWSEIDARHGFTAVRATLSDAVDAGELAASWHLDELTRLLLGAVSQAGLDVGRGASSTDLLDRYQVTIDLFLDRLAES